MEPIMLDALIQLALFAAKAIIIAMLILLVLSIFFALLAKGKEKLRGRLTIKNISKKYAETTETILTEILPKKLFKKFLREQKTDEKKKNKLQQPTKNIFILNFHGDIKASAVTALREEITAILNIATPCDEVILKLESAGGAVHGYGLAAAQLMRIRAHNIPLTITVDKIAASGGYMMACVANKILAAPFAILGSIGVIMQLPNFHRLLKNKHIDFEQHMAGEYKRTLTIFGENTQEGREKLQHELDDIHQSFKKFIAENREQIDISKVATGEHWLGQQALELKLIDEIKTSDEYLLEQNKKAATLYEISYETKKSFGSKCLSAANVFYEKLRLFYTPSSAHD
jgi:serine protease SohB